MSLKIGITQTETNAVNYPKWIKGDDDIEIIDLSFERFNLEDIEQCDGIVFTGGVDSHPKYFLEDYSVDYPNAPSEFIERRDDFELAVLKKATEEKIPVLGICRGMQLINIFYKGTLHLDLGEGNQAHKKADGIDKQHPVLIKEGSLFSEITGTQEGLSNSAHHQAIDRVGQGLEAVAFSPDQVVEAIELKNPEGQFLVAVQWHPERIPDKETNPLSKNIREAFLNASKQN